MDFSDIVKNGFPTMKQPAPTKMGITAQPQAPNAFSQNPYNFNTAPSADEQAAGVTPPQYFSSLNQDGSLKSPYAVDPTKSQAFQQMSNIAQSSSLSPWAQMQSDMNKNQTAQQRDALSAQTAGQTDSAMQRLMSTGGGTGSGAAMMLAQQGQRANIMGNQNIGAQSLNNDLNIAGTDAQNKQGLLGQVANTETGALSANAATAIGDTQNANAFSANRYNQLMGAWGAAKTADAQRAAAAGGGGKGGGGIANAVGTWTSPLASVLGGGK